MISARRKWLVGGLISLSVAAGVGGYLVSRPNQDEVSLRALVDHVRETTHGDPAKVDEVVRLLNRAGSPKLRQSITTADVDRLEVLTHDSSLDIRSWAYGALCSLRLTPHRERAIKLIAGMKTDPSKDYRRGYFVKAWALDAPDWREEATKALNDPDEADMARQVLARGAPKP